MTVRISGYADIPNSMALQNLALNDRVCPKEWTRWTINIAGNHQDSPYASFAADPSNEVVDVSGRFVGPRRNVRDRLESSFAKLFCRFYQPQGWIPRRRGYKDLRRRGKDFAERIELRLLRPHGLRGKIAHQ